MNVMDIPGLNGYVAAKIGANQDLLSQIQAAGGLMALQSNLEMKPLQAALLRSQVNNAELAARIKAGLFSGVPAGVPQVPQTMAFSEGGVSVPGGQANLNTGQVIPNAPQLQSGPGMFRDENQAITAMLAGDPGITAAAKAYLEQNKPIAAREGAPVINPSTGQILFYAPKLEAGMMPTYRGGQVTGVSNIPGYVPAMTERGNAQEQSRAGYDLVDVPVAGGGTRRMSRLDALKQLGSSGVGEQDPMAGRPKNEIDAINAVRSGQAVSARTTPTGSEIVRPAGSPSGEFGATQSEADKTYSNERAKFYAERSGKLTDSWYASNEMNTKLDLIQSLFANPGVASGTLAENISDLKGIADSFGIETKGKSSEDVLRAVTNEMALRTRNSGGTNLMPGAVSDFEQRLMRSMVPNLAQSKEGRMLMIQVMRAKVMQDMKVSELAAEYEQRNGKLDSGFEKYARDYLKQNPMFDESKAAAMTELAKRLASGKR